MNWNNRIRFCPWIGENYKQGYPVKDKMVKVLVVGESHYKDGSHDDNGERTFTQNVVANYLTQKKNRGWRPSNYWTKLGRTVAGRDKYIPDNFWHNIAYYNFVQDFAGDGPRQRPTLEMWEQSYFQFQEVIRVLEPEKIIIVGLKTWSHAQRAIPIANQGVINKIDGNTVKIEIFNIVHPSSFGFKSGDHYPEINNFLNKSS